MELRRIRLYFLLTSPRDDLKDNNFEQWSVRIYLVSILLSATFLFLLSSHLSHSQKRKLDAVYYYMRSLAASNPILTAKESLMSLFEEAKRKVRLTLLSLTFARIFILFFLGLKVCQGLFNSQLIALAQIDSENSLSQNLENEPWWTLIVGLTEV